MTTFIAALRVDRIEACFLPDGAVNSDSFHSYVEREFVLERDAFGLNREGRISAAVEI